MKQITSLSTAYLKHNRLVHAIGAYLDYQLSLRLKKPILHHYPPALMIEPTNICNLKCPLCPSGNGSLKRARGMMSLQDFRNIVDMVYQKIGMLILWNQGEPFLNPDFYAMIEYAGFRNLYTLTSTNASLPLDTKRIVNSGLNKIIISMDGISKQTYNEYRVNGNYDLVLQNLQELVEMKKMLKSSTPKIVWQFIIMRQNEHEIEAVKKLAKDWQIDHLDFKTVQIYSPDDLHFLPSNHKYSRYADSENVILKTQLLNRCRRLWTQPVINWDGELSVCCYDKDVDFKVGNLKEQTFESLWFGGKINRMRQAILKNRAGIPMCQNCGEGIVQFIT